MFEGEVKMPDAGQQQRPSRLETEYFTFGAFEWNVSIDLTQGDGEFLPRIQIIYLPYLCIRRPLAKSLDR